MKIDSALCSLLILLLFSSGVYTHGFSGVCPELKVPDDAVEAFRATMPSVCSDDNMAQIYQMIECVSSQPSCPFEPTGKELRRHCGILDVEDGYIFVPTNALTQDCWLGYLPPVFKPC